MTTDTGIDLVAYFPKGPPTTIQVKANLKPKPSGGRGKMALDWWVADTCPAAMVALVDLETERVWLIPQNKLSEIAQQKSGGRLHFYLYTDPQSQPRLGGRLVQDFERFLIEQQIEKLLASPI